MARRILLTTCILTFLCGGSLQSQWLPQQTALLPQDYMILSMRAVDRDVVWGVADTSHAMGPAVGYPRVIRTSDGGETWRNYTIPGMEGMFLMDIFPLDENTAWVTANCLRYSAAYMGGIYRTTDGGNTWTAHLENKQTLFLHFFNEQQAVHVNAWAVDITEDGGMTWQTIPAEDAPAYRPNEGNIVYSTNNALAAFGDTVWIPSTQGRIFRSTDRGYHWTVASIPQMDSRVVTSVSFRDARHGLAVSCLNNSDYGLSPTIIARSSDGGDSWELVPPALSEFSGTCIAYIPGTPKTYVMVGGYLPGTAYTTDEGDSWQFVDMDTYHSGLSFVDPLTGWTTCLTHAGYEDCYVQKWTGTLLPVEELASSTVTFDFALHGCYPNPFGQSATISFDIPRAGTVQLSVHDVLGRCVHEQAVSPTRAGRHDIRFVRGRLPAGMYFARLSWQGQTVTGRIAIVK